MLMMMRRRMREWRGKEREKKGEQKIQKIKEREHTKYLLKRLRSRINQGKKRREVTKR